MIISEFHGTLIVVVAGSVLSALVTWLYFSARMPVSHRVAIIGFPRSGKTTLITAILEYLFRHGERGRRIVPRGEETRTRIYDHFRQIKYQKAIQPTTYQEIFAYRSEVTVRSGFFNRRYKLEIADFPGEDSVFYTDQLGESLYDNPYFQWVSTADAFVFVINAGFLLEDHTGEYVRGQTRALRTAWQLLKEHHIEGATSLATKPLLLVFSKVDLLLPRTDDPYPTVTEPFPPLRCVSESEIEAAVHHVIGRYDDLIDYLNRESQRLHIILTSAFATVGDERVGIPELAWRILPRSKLLSFIIDGMRFDESPWLTNRSNATDRPNNPLPGMRGRP